MNQNFAFLTSSQSIIEYYIIHKVLKKDKKSKKGNWNTNKNTYNLHYLMIQFTRMGV